MWFLFGFLTLIGFFFLAVWGRLRPRWKGEGHGSGHAAYEYYEERNKNKVRSFRIGVPAPPGFDFALKPESLVDGFFKAIGLSREHQFDDEGLDRSVYVVSDDLALCRRIAQAAALREDLRALFGTPREGPYALDELRCAGERIWLDFEARKGFDPAHAHALAQDVVPTLRHFAAVLASIPNAPVRGWRDPFVLRAVLILSVSTALAINGAVQLARTWWSEVPFTESPAALLPPALVAGGVLVALLAVATLAFLGRTARAHLVLLEILLVGSFGAVATAYSEVRDVNMEWDRSAGQVHEVEVLDKRVSRGRRSTSYYLRLQPWPGHPGTGEVRVSRDAYDWFRVNERVQVHVRPGWLGHRWVSSISSMERR